MDAGQVTLVTAAGTTQSPTRHGCPGVHAVPGYEERFVVSREVDDPGVLDVLAPHVGTDQAGRRELVGSVPAWVPSVLMDMGTLADFIESSVHRAGDSVFRHECLPCYADDSDGDDFARWVAGEPEPDWGRLQPWLDELTKSAAAGVTRRRVRRLSAALTDYERYACEWGYAHTAAAGEDVRVLRDGEHGLPGTAVPDVDFWVLNDETVVPVLYDGRGRFVGAGILAPGAGRAFLADRDAVWAAAEPFTDWWARHPELRRAAG